ncbi:protein cereblon-like [Mytilus trossulus]|uniref:protein cereblon-like n=1 Tax=Mytilus trossulus TaxID=6551 RepID=UPI003006AC17
MSASMKAILHPILHYLFLFLSVYTLMHSVHCISEDITDYLLCRKCGHEIARGTDLTAVPSKLAHRQRNDSISGVKDVLIQLFQNPHGLYFEVVTTQEADVQPTGEYSNIQTWFLDYMWQLVACPRCGTHLGWLYSYVGLESQKPKSFIGLILQNLLEDIESQTIIHIPKAYGS